MTDAVQQRPSTDETVAMARTVLEGVGDPEIPVLSVVDLGIIRDVTVAADGTLRVSVSLTYSGCPASAVIREDIRAALTRAGLGPVTVSEVLSPAWTSDWISAEGREKLLNYGIAPPAMAASSLRQMTQPAQSPDCPRCGSSDTELISEFGSTPCKALHRCRACLEPFDRFKCI